VLIDTDLFVWHMRGFEEAKEALASIEVPATSLVTYMELLQGARSAAESAAIRRYLSVKQVKVHPLTEAIGNRASFLMERWSISHGLRLADALIAATAMHHGLPLLTGNARHYQFLPGLDVHRFVAPERGPPGVR